ASRSSDRQRSLTWRPNSMPLPTTTRPPLSARAVVVVSVAKAPTFSPTAMSSRANPEEPSSASSSVVQLHRRINLHRSRRVVLVFVGPDEMVCGEHAIGQAGQALDRRVVLLEHGRALFL